MRPRCTVPATTAATSEQCDRGCSSAELTRLLLDGSVFHGAVLQVLMIEYPCS